MLFLLFSPASAFAACSTPAGVEGELVYNQDYKIVQFCEGTNWIKLGGTTLDARIGTLTATKWCAANAGGTAIDCTQNAPSNSTITLSGDVTGSGTTAITTAIGANKVLDTMLRQSAGLSLIGRAASTTGDVADITAASDFQVMRRSGTAIGFGAVNLASSNAVTGVLGAANLGTGTANTTTFLRGDGSWQAISVGAGNITADSLDFTEFKDAMALDASTDIATGAFALTITNDGTGDSLRVNDNTAGDTSPFVIDSAGKVGIGTTGPTALLDVYSTSVATRMRMNPGTTTANAAGIFTGFAHNDTLMGAYLDGVESNGFISTGYANSARYFSIGTASGSTFSTATYVPILTVANSGRVGISTLVPTAALHLPASTTAAASLRIASGVAPTAPNDGDVWYDGTHAYIRVGSTSYQLDQQSGGATSPLNLSAAAGGILNFTDPGLAHGITATTPAYATTTYLQIEEIANDDGGARLIAFSDTAGQDPLRLMGYFGSTDPTDTVPAIQLVGGKRTSTSTAALGAAETILGVSNNSLTNLFTILGNGNVGIGTSGPIKKLEIYGGHTDTTMRLFSTGDGSGNTGILNLWASEPQVTYTGVGIGNNLYMDSGTGLARTVTTRGGSFIRLLDGSINMNVVNAAGTSTTALTLGTGGAATLASTLNVTGATTLSGGASVAGTLTLSTANATISNSSYIQIPNGVYVSGGTAYFGANIIARNGISNDSAASLTISGGTSGITTIVGDIRAPIMYDSNNTGYYVDPASTTYVNTLTTAANINVYGRVGFQGTPNGSGAYVCADPNVGWYSTINSYCSLSDVRLKKDIKSLEDGALDRVLKLRPLTYEWKDERRGKGREMGFVAQEVEKIFPLLVDTNPDGMKGLDYAKMISPVVKAIQEFKSMFDGFKADTALKLNQHDTEIKALQAENAALKAQNTVIMKRLESLESKK